jgi:hypothetical protein
VRSDSDGWKITVVTTHPTLFLVAILAGGRSRLFHGVAGPAEPVGDILAEIRDMTVSDLFLVALLAFTFHVTLVGTVGERNAVLEREDCGAVISEGCNGSEKNCRK